MYTTTESKSMTTGRM